MPVKVTLLNYTPNPEQTVAMAAKLCYSPSGIEDIRDGLTEEKTAAFIDMLSDLGHASPIEHASFTFGIEGISRACSHQLVRHRIASYSQQSQRYVDGTKFDFVTPPAIAANEKALAAYEKVISAQSEAYREIRDALAAGYIREFTGEEAGRTDSEVMADFSEKDKKRYSAFVKKANEDARFILPNASTTKIVCTFNARSLHNFFAHRCCNRAQWEIREVAEQMLLLCLEVAPHLFKNCGPSCLFGPCPEGAMSCGKAAEVRRKYGSLDGSGKATQTKLLFEKLNDRGMNVRRLEFPDYDSPSSALVKMYLGGEFGNKPEDVNAYAASAFYAVDRIAGFLKDWKRDYQGDTVFLSDRYATSNLIYQMSKLPESEWENYIKWQADFEYDKLGLPRPDAVLYLDVEPDVSQKLMEKRYGGDNSKKDLHESNLRFLLSCRESALYAVQNCGWQLINCCESGDIKPIEKIAADIEAALESIIC